MATHPVRLPIDDLASRLGELKAELRLGHTVELISGGQVLADVRSRSQGAVAGTASQRPDFAAQLKRLWGNRALDVDTTAWIREDRDA